jgi:hypothetical protein
MNSIFFCPVVEKENKAFHSCYTICWFFAFCFCFFLTLFEHLRRAIKMNRHPVMDDRPVSRGSKQKIMKLKEELTNTKTHTIDQGSGFMKVVEYCNGTCL